MSRLDSQVVALGYLGVTSPSIGERDPYAARFLGMQAGERVTGMARYRMDDRLHRLTIHEGSEAGGIRYFGWEVNDATALQALASDLRTRGIVVRAADAALRAERAVSDLIVFADPAGNRLEAFHGAQTADQPFVPGRSISGFRSGPLGIGHVVLTVADLDPRMHFCRDVLGFGVSSSIVQPFRAVFMHVDGRHHALALIRTGKPGSSLWGHDRHWLPADAQREARDMRLRDAAQGTRHRVQVLPGQHEVTPER